MKYLVCIVFAPPLFVGKEQDHYDCDISYFETRAEAYKALKDFLKENKRAIHSSTVSKITHWE